MSAPIENGARSCVRRPTISYDKDRDLAAVNARRMELAQRVGFLETTIRLAIIELSGIEKVSATGARVAQALREAVEKT